MTRGGHSRRAAHAGPTKPDWMDWSAGCARGMGLKGKPRFPGAQFRLYWYMRYNWTEVKKSEQLFWGRGGRMPRAAHSSLSVKVWNVSCPAPSRTLMMTLVSFTSGSSATVQVTVPSAATRIPFGPDSSLKVTPPFLARAVTRYQNSVP